MILMFDYFETLLRDIRMDFNQGLKPLWEKHYSDKCSFEEIKAFGEEMYELYLEYHKQETEFPFVKEELPRYAEKFGGDIVEMNVQEEAEFLLLCNEMYMADGVAEMLAGLKERGIPMYILSNSGFRGEALGLILERYGIGQYFTKLWSSADYGKIKPCKAFFDHAISEILKENPDQSRNDIIFVGDTYKTDIKGAHDAGIRAAWINRRKEEDPYGYAAYELDEVTDIMEIVRAEA